MKTSHRFTLFVGLVVLLVAASPLFLARYPRPDPEPLRIALNPWLGYDTLRTAEKLGFLAEEEVSVAFMEKISSASARRSFERGEVDFFGTSLTGLIFMQSDTLRPAVAIAILGISRGLDVILAVPEVRTFGDLQGKRIAVEGGSSDVLLLAAALRKHGLDARSVEVVLVPRIGMREALKNRTVSAVCSLEPETTRLRQEFGLHPVFDSTEAPEPMVRVLMVDPAVLRERRKEISAMLRANSRVIGMLGTDPEPVLNCFSECEQIPKEKVLEQLHRLELSTTDEQVLAMKSGGFLEKAIRSSADVLLRCGAIAESISPEQTFTSEIVDSLEKGGTR